MRTQHEQQTELAIVMTTAMRHIVSLPSSRHDGWRLTGGLPLSPPYRVVPDARNEWEVAAACNADLSCEGFTADGRLYRWVGIGTLASVFSKSEKKLSRAHDAGPVYEEVKKHRQRMPAVMLQAAVASRLAATQGQSSETDGTSTSLAEAVARLLEEWAAADGLLPPTGWPAQPLAAVRERKEAAGLRQRLLESKSPTGTKADAIENSKSQENITDTATRPPDYVAPPPSLTDAQWKLVEVAARAVVAAPFWLADAAVEAVSMASMQEGEGAAAVATVDELRAAVGLPSVAMDADETASEGADLGRFKGLDGVLRIVRETAKGVEERRKAVVLATRKSLPAPRPGALRAPSNVIFTKRTVSGMPRVVPIEPAVPLLESYAKTRDREAAAAKEEAEEHRQSRLQRMMALRGKGH